MHTHTFILLHHLGTVTKIWNLYNSPFGGTLCSLPLPLLFRYFQWWWYLNISSWRKWWPSAYMHLPVKMLVAHKCTEGQTLAPVPRPPLQRQVSRRIESALGELTIHPTPLMEVLTRAHHWPVRSAMTPAAAGPTRNGPPALPMLRKKVGSGSEASSSICENTAHLVIYSGITTQRTENPCIFLTLTISPERPRLMPYNCRWHLDCPRRVRGSLLLFLAGLTSHHLQAKSSPQLESGLHGWTFALDSM